MHYYCYYSDRLDPLVRGKCANERHIIFSSSYAYFYVIAVLD